MQGSEKKPVTDGKSPPAASFAAAYFPFKKKKMFLFHGWKFAHQIPSHSQEIMSFIQVKQNKISWDKFLQIPANFEITSRQI
jgi:hypothetical protein